jgi:excisionase family DNA binding protein
MIRYAQLWTIHSAFECLGEDGSVHAVDEDYLPVAEAATRLRVSPSTIRRWIREGDLPAYRLGRRRVGLKRDDLDRLVTPVRTAAYENQMSHITTTSIRQFTAEERRRGLEIMDELERMAKAITAERGAPFPPSTELLAQQREERTRQLWAWNDLRRCVGGRQMDPG